MGHQQQVKPNRFSSQYVAYGNQAILEHSYMINGLPGRRGGAVKEEGASSGVRSLEAGRRLDFGRRWER